MIFQRLNAGIEVSDSDFDTLYSKRVREISKLHFTPVEVARTAARFLVEKPGTRVLDIGSGAGKFCMIGASCTNGFFTGVEYRESLHRLSWLLSKCHGIHNTKFIHSNIMEIEFRTFDAIYFFNSFYENIFPDEPIDGSVRLDKSLYAIYAQYMKEQLNTMPKGTRLATYFCYMTEIPNSYKVQSKDFDGKLKLWVKTE
ncbi:MAG: methyltransferase domain-containing protein [Haliscomenobacteraceae bacterium CHB4]|nr:hypothetical protein [Saprospiraceae bacterium]MCE7921873.1 methyltransferase domain-containing protein [Haliscomenobacteraceae bacterium CHB4]